MGSVSVEELLKQKEMLAKKREEARSSMEQYHGAIAFIDHLVALVSASEESEKEPDS